MNPSTDEAKTIPASGAGECTEYDVFISYSRRDVVFARALETALKAYRPPHDLPVAQHRLRVFRDEADLTGTDYAQAIRGHLAAARKLIVLCTPSARASPYVNEEIQLFGEQRGADSIIPVLIDGVPNNEATSELAARMAFPEALCRLMTTPLAADFRGFHAIKPRPDRGEHEHAWFKLLADLYGLSRHVVEQREKRRQARTRRLWIGGTGVVVSALAALSIWALLSRAEAIRQGEISAAGLVTAQARMLSSADVQTVERQALLALEAWRRLREHGGVTDDAETVLSRALGRLPQRIHAFEAQDHAPVLAFSADGLRLFRVVGLRLETWNLQQLRIEQTFELQRPVAQLIPSPDNQQLAAIGPDGAMTMLFVGVSTVEGPSEPEGAAPVAEGVLCVAFSHDGRSFATLQRTDVNPHEVRVWRAADSHLYARLALPYGMEADPHAGIAPCLAFSHATNPASGDGRAALLVAGQGSALVWRLPSDSAGDTDRYSVISPDVKVWEDVTGASFNFEGTQVLLTRVSRAGPGSELLRIDIGSWNQHIVTVAEPHSGRLSPDGRYFTTTWGFGSDPYVPLLRHFATDIRDTIDGSVRVELPLAGRFSTDGTRFITTEHELVRIWDLSLGQESHRVIPAKPVTDVRDSPGGRYLALIAENHSVELWDTGHPQELLRIAGERTGSLEARGGIVVTTGPSGRRLVDIAQGRTIARLPPADSESEMVISPTGTRVVGPFIPPGRFYFGDRASLEQRLFDPEGNGPVLWKGKSAVRAAFAADGSRLVMTYSDGALGAHSADDGKELWRISLGAVPDHLLWAHDGRSVLVGLVPVAASVGNHEVIVLDADSGVIKQRLPATSMTALASDATGQLVALASSATVSVFDASDGSRLSEIALPSTLNHVGAIAFTADGRRLVTLAGSRASTFLGASFFTEQAGFVWNVAGGPPIARIPPGLDRAAGYPETLEEEEKAYIVDAMLSEDGRRMAATEYPSRRAYWITRAERGTKDAVVWDLTGELPHEILRRPAAKLKDVAADANFVLVEIGSALQVWMLDRSILAEAACARLSRNLTHSEWAAYFGDQPYQASCPDPR